MSVPRDSLEPVVMTPAGGVDPHELRVDADTRVRLRSVRPDDRSRFRQGFLELSDESRYSRCFSYRQSLTEVELDMLCNVDGIEHVALVALSLDDTGLEAESIGGARFIRNRPDDDEAELAFLVTDTWQGRGVGRQILVRLVDIAQARGIFRLRCHLLPGNARARQLLGRISELTGWTLAFDEECGVLRHFDQPSARPSRH